MIVAKKIKSALLFLGICLGIYVIFILYYLSENACFNCSPQDYYDRGIAIILENDNNLKKGLRFINTAAKKDNVEATIFLGELYLNTFPDTYITNNKEKIALLGSIVSQDIDKGESYFNDLIKNQSFFDRKYSNTHYSLSILYKAGILKSKDKEEAYKKWLTISSDNGNSLATYQMALYFNNKGKYKKALKWFTKAFNYSKDTASAIMIGDYYFYGKGVAKNYRQSIQWYQQALSVPELPDTSLMIKHGDELIEGATQRLNIAEKKVRTKTSKQLVVIKYSIRGGVNLFSIFTPNLNGNLIGKVKKQDSDILALFNMMDNSIHILKSTKVASMDKGLYWVLNAYAENKYGADKDFNFVITK